MTIIHCTGCLGAGTPVETQKKVLSLSCIFGSCGILDRILLCWCFGGSSITILPLLVLSIRTSVRSVNTVQYHDTFGFFLPDSET